MPAADTLITLCTYNERENIEHLAPEIFAVAPDAHVLIIDDNSPDGTGDYADGLAKEDDRVRVLHREGKQGLGSAIVARGYAFQKEILYRCRRVGCSFEEVPIVFEDRRYGESKINKKEVVAALWVIFRLGVGGVLRERVTK